MYGGGIAAAALPPASLPLSPRYGGGGLYALWKHMAPVVVDGQLRVVCDWTARSCMSTDSMPEWLRRSDRPMAIVASGEEEEGFEAGALLGIGTEGGVTMRRGGVG